MAETPDSPIEDAVRDDLNTLIGTALGVAGDQLEEQGAFLPVALVLALDGEMRLVAVSPSAGEGEDLDADVMVDDLYEALTQQRETNRAAAVVCDIHLPEEDTDAIHVIAEHSSGVSVAAVRPYRQVEGQWTFDEPFLEAGERAIWT
ncbi:hypothetical protein [Specibacter cremeus]|uniref:hypothetical protein n=1 Tax=Specibacter cremeus TaxID=1629051 RepID=UPI000F771365|nr:hypothetical protein [Specibacter cremeus]